MPVREIGEEAVLERGTLLECCSVEYLDRELAVELLQDAAVLARGGEACKRHADGAGHIETVMHRGVRGGREEARLIRDRGRLARKLGCKRITEGIGRIVVAELAAEDTHGL